MASFKGRGEGRDALRMETVSRPIIRDEEKKIKGKVANFNGFFMGRREDERKRRNRGLHRGGKTGKIDKKLIRNGVEVLR
jgi:hypothetical protein